jgi:hypothetical protein
MFGRMVGGGRMASRGGGGLLREEGGDLSLGWITGCAGELALCSGSRHLSLSLCNTECLSMTEVVIIVKLESCGRIAALKDYTNKQC